MPYRKKLVVSIALLLMIVLMACMGSMYSVQRCGGLIDSDTPVTIADTIALPGQTCRYRAVLPEGSALTARVTRVSGDIDPVLTVEDDSGTVLASDDDSGGSDAALIERFTLGDPGSVDIVVSAYGNDTTGEFELLVDIKNEP